MQTHSHMNTDTCDCSPPAPAPAKVAPRRFHVSLNTSDLQRSIQFYRVLTGTEPAKQHDDYAKFEIDDPPLVLSLEPRSSRSGGVLNHLGIRMTDSEALVEIQKRLEDAGFRTKRQKGVKCCYALQTKFWVSDPDGALWEMYTLHEDIDHRGSGHVPLTLQAASGNLGFSFSRAFNFVRNKVFGGGKCCPLPPQDQADLAHSSEH